MADFLQPDEEVLWTTRRRGASIVDEVTFASVAAIVLVGAVVWFQIAVWPLGWGLFGIPAITVTVLALGTFILQRVWRVKTSVYTVTPQRVYKAYGRIGYYLGQTTYDKVTDLHVKQSLFGRILGFGTVRLQTAGAGLALEGLDDPFGTKQTIEAARNAYIERLAGRIAKKARQPRTVETVWTAQPSLQSFMANLLVMGIVAVASLGVIVAGIVIPGAVPILIFGGIGIVASGLGVAGVAIHRAYTHYSVTSNGVVVASGWLARRRVETTYEKVTDVTTYQGLLGRFLGFGTITINTAGSNEAPVAFRGVEDPEGVKRTIDEARKAWK